MKFKHHMRSLFLCFTLVAAITPIYASAVDENLTQDVTGQPSTSVSDSNSADDTIINDSSPAEDADSTTEDTSPSVQSGTITVSYLDGTSGISGATFDIYKVATRQEHLTLAFQLVDALADLDVNITTPDSDDITKLASAVTDKQLPAAGSASTDANGKAEFSNVEEGLYLLVQTKSTDNYEDTTPSLISIPSTDGSYSVTALPKSSRKPETPTNPTTPSKTPTTTPTITKSQSPKTGVDGMDYSIPIAVMFGSGATLVGATLLKCTTKKSTKK